MNEVYGIGLTASVMAWVKNTQGNPGEKVGAEAPTSLTFLSGQGGGEDNMNRVADTTAVL